MEKTIFRDYLTIDAEARKISIPSRIKNLGVESDADVKRLYFKIQKQYGEMDFTKADIRINFVNANGEGDAYAVTDKQVEGGTVTFSWLVGRNATEYKGDVCFIVCAKISSAEGVVEKEFNTTLASLPVLEGKETVESGGTIVPEPEPTPQEEYPAWEPYNGIPPVKWQTGSKCTHNGKKWESMVDNNVWEPGAFGVDSNIWREIA